MQPGMMQGGMMPMMGGVGQPDVMTVMGGMGQPGMMPMMAGSSTGVAPTAGARAASTGDSEDLFSGMDEGTSEGVPTPTKRPGN